MEGMCGLYVCGAQSSPSFPSSGQDNRCGHHAQLLVVFCCNCGTQSAGGGTGEGQELPEEMPWPQRGTVVCWLTRQDPAMTALTRNETRLVIPVPGQASQPPDTSDPSTHIRSDLLKWATETTHLWR